MLLDGEFSFARRQNSPSYEIQLSSLPWREGMRIDLSWAVSASGDGRAQDRPGWRYLECGEFPNTPLSDGLSRSIAVMASS